MPSSSDRPGMCPVSVRNVPSSGRTARRIELMRLKSDPPNGMLAQSSRRCSFDDFRRGGIRLVSSPNHREYGWSSAKLGSSSRAGEEPSRGLTTASAVQIRKAESVNDVTVAFGYSMKLSDPAYGSAGFRRASFAAQFANRGRSSRPVEVCVTSGHAEPLCTG
jgi:hypothetical protein